MIKMTLDKDVLDYLKLDDIGSSRKVRAEKIIKDRFKSYSTETRSLIKKVLKEYHKCGRLHDSKTYQTLLNYDFLREVPDPLTFLEDPYYMGAYTETLYPKNKDLIVEVLDPKKRYTEMALTGSIGWGKTFISELVLIYKLLELSCLRNPSDYFGLRKDSQIVFGIFNVHKYKGKSLSIDLRTMIDGSPYFCEYFPRPGRATKSLEFPHNISFVIGAQEVAILGENVLSFLMDEVNFMKETKRMSVDDIKELRGQAEKLYTATRTRIQSRFHDVGREAPGITIAISSKQSESSWLEKHIAEVRSDPSVYIRSQAIYDVKPEKYSKEYFYVQVGDIFNDSKILGDNEIANKDAKVVEIPIDFRRAFEIDIDRSLRDISGTATLAVNPLIRRRDRVGKMMDNSIPYPFTKEIISISTEDTIELSDYLDMSKLVKVSGGQYHPLVRPAAKRLIHVDLSTVGCSTGFCMGHVYYDKEKQLPFLYIDVVLEIIPPIEGEIDFEKIRNFIINLGEMGFKFGAISYDGWQSKDSVQRLLQYFGKKPANPPRGDKQFRGGGSQVKVPMVPVVNVHELSVDRDDTAYLHAKEFIDTECCTSYYYKPLLTEIIAVQHDFKARKVTRNDDDELKDVADAFAGVAHHAMEQEDVIYRS